MAQHRAVAAPEMRPLRIADGKLARACRRGFVLFAALLGSAASAWAGVGVAVVLDLPRSVNTGDRGLPGSITITNVNNFRDESARNLVVLVGLTPSCASAALATECPSPWEDPGVVAIDSFAVGRNGTACGGTVFAVTERDATTGLVTFDPPGGFFMLGPVTAPVSARQCIIDFTFSMLVPPAEDSGLATSATAAGTAVRAVVGALSASGMRPGMGENMTILQVNL